WKKIAYSYLWVEMWQVMTGYMLAGSIVGPVAFSFVTEIVQVETLFLFGVILLLFAPGVEYSTSKVCCVFPCLITFSASCCSSSGYSGRLISNLSLYVPTRCNNYSKLSFLIVIIIVIMHFELYNIIYLNVRLIFGMMFHFFPISFSIFPYPYLNIFWMGGRIEISAA
ncbi:hypothetical protein KSS87_012454, partial [Heliosperma pusillum]